VPFYRLEKLEGSLGIPLPAATQWEVVEEVAVMIKPGTAARLWTNCIDGWKCSWRTRKPNRTPA
jgi:hypothetical protein